MPFLKIVRFTYYNRTFFLLSIRYNRISQYRQSSAFDNGSHSLHLCQSQLSTWSGTRGATC